MTGANQALGQRLQAQERNLKRQVMRIIGRIVCTILFGILGFASIVKGQTGTATISGLVTDESGAVIVKAELELKSVDKGFVTTTSSNRDGIYVFAAVQPGSYDLTVRRNGFKQVDFLNLLLNTQDHVQQNFRLQVGSVSESVTVNANGEHMETDNPAVGVLVDRDFVENMPLNGRSFQDLIALAPGAVSSANSPGNFSINGQRDDANYFSIDGTAAPTNPTYGTYYGEGLSGTAPGVTAVGTTQNLVSVDALEEFRIQTSTYSAEFGRQPGGQIQFRTRSGGNEFHGSLFDYFRNEALDANSWWNIVHQFPRGVDRQNDFGGTLGGPIEIPKLYDGKDHTFFFFSYEGLRQHLPVPVVENEPTVAFRQSASASVQPFLNAFPIPNGLANDDGITAVFNAQTAATSSFDAVSVRVDHTFGQKVQVFGRYSDTPSSALTYQGAGIFNSNVVNTRTATIGATANFSLSLSDELRFNYTSIQDRGGYESTDLGGAVPFPSTLLIPSQYANNAAVAAVIFALPNSSPLPGYEIGHGQAYYEKQISIVDSATWTQGRHSIKFGGDWRRLLSTFSVESYGNILEFTALSDVQQGLASTQYLVASQVAKPIFDNLSLFALDHWKVTPRLTLDYGVRWEFNPVPGSSNGIYPVAVTQTSDLATMALAPAGTSAYSTTYDHFAPRLGFAYQVTPSTAHALTVRGGGGVFYDVGQNLGAAGFDGYPFAQAAINSEVPLPLQGSSLVPPSLSQPLVPPYQALYFLTDRHLTLPYTEQWSLSLDQQLSSKNTFTVSYVGNLGRKLLFNQDYPNIGSVNPNFTYVGITNNSAASSYNALQVQDQGYIAPGLQVVAAYVWAHARDSGSTAEGIFGDEPTWGNSDNDIRQSFNMAMNYQIPAKNEGNRFVQFLTKGWLLANRFEALTGYPFTVYQGNYCPPNTTQCPNFTPDLVPGVPIYLHNVPNAPGGWQLNPKALQPVPLDPTTGAPLAVGTLGRNFLHGPAFWTLNTSLQRNFAFTERLSLAFRVEAFNIFNHPTYAGIDNFLTDATFGQARAIAAINGTTYATGGPRILQLSLKLHF